MRPDLEQESDYLYEISFGAKGAELDRFISRAYCDMNRTFGGISKRTVDVKRNNTLRNTLLNAAKAKVNQMP
jgi:hypothetical protein